ncbi:MAG: peptidoglycan endopeptidase [Deltaproteobacteria bacterium]|nr:peptidoglycan endopeptidase [Deltaproteobacteria bacterium]
MAFILVLIGISAFVGGCSLPRYAVAERPVPVLNTPDFGSVFGGIDGRTLDLDRCGQILALEFIALPGTDFKIEDSITTFPFPVYRVTSSDYPYPSESGYYVDSRMVRTTYSPPAPRKRTLPDPETISARLASAVGTPYRWGSNLRQGIPEMSVLYPPAPDQHLANSTQNSWTLRGLDCSGLLYEATAGWTPRNTSELVGYGSPVPIAGLDADGIMQKIQPLDLIVWKGHVMIILDRERLIESRLDCQGTAGGVTIRNLPEALQQLLASRIPLNEYARNDPAAAKGFVIRRWHPEARFD